jgi:hypothetical protein
MKYALHASLHRPARRPDQTASRLGGKVEDGASPQPDVEAAASKPARPSFLPPPPTVIHQGGRPTLLSTPPAAVVTTAHDRPTLRFPAVPPPAEPLPAQGLEGAGDPVESTRDKTTEQIPVTAPTPIIDINEPTLEEAPVRVEDFAEENEDREPAKPRIARARKKGTPAPRHAAPVHHVMPDIDPAAWLADEAHARSSDRRDSADGVDNSDTVVPVPRPTPYV